MKISISFSYFIYSLVLSLHTSAIIFTSVSFNELIFQMPSFFTSISFNDLVFPIPAWVSFSSNLSTFKAVFSGEVTLPTPPPAAHPLAARDPIFLGARAGHILDFYLVCLL